MANPPRKIHAASRKAVRRQKRRTDVERLLWDTDYDQRSFDKVFEQSVKALTSMEKSGSDSTYLYASVFRDLWLLLPQTTTNFGSGHDFPIRAAYFELQTSVVLAMRGLYRYAFIALRSALELGLVSIYYHGQEDYHLKIQGWLHSDKDTPNYSEIVPRVYSSQSMLGFNRKFKWDGDLKDLRDELDDYAHSKGVSYSSFGHLWSPSPTAEGSLGAVNLDPGKLATWAEDLRKVVRLVAIPHVLMYPLAIIGIKNTWSSSGSRSFPVGMLNVTQANRLRSILSSEERGYFEARRHNSKVAQVWLGTLGAWSGVNLDEVFSDGDLPWALDEYPPCAAWLEEQREMFDRSAWSAHDLQVFRERVAYAWLVRFAPEKLSGIGYIPKEVDARPIKMTGAWSSKLKQLQDVGTAVKKKAEQAVQNARKDKSG